VTYGTSGNDGGASWRAFKPALVEAMAHGGYLALHEYDAPYLGLRVIGDVWDPKAEGWLMLRYRMVMRYLLTLGILPYHPVSQPAVLKLLFTETGVDGGVTSRPGHQGGGWRDFVDMPDPTLGNYAHQRAWYEWQLSHDQYVMGVTSFGENSADPGWDSFSILTDGAMEAELIAVELGIPRLHFGDPTPPAPPVPPVKPPVPPVKPPAPPVATAIPFAWIAVLSSDGWWGIARRAYGTSSSALAKKMQDANPGVTKLEAGLVLNVGGYHAVRVGLAHDPNMFAGTPFAGCLVAPGDTWAKIAKRYGVTETALKTANSTIQRLDPGTAIVCPGWSLRPN
jgi:hypothetical protein